MGVFNNYAAGVYPYYPVLASDAIAPNPTLQLFIGYPGSPPTVVIYTLVTSAAARYTTVPLTPALLAPGDPAFSGAGSSTTNYNPSPTSGTVSATVNAPSPITLTNSLDFSGWAAIPVIPGDTVNINITYNATHSSTGGIGTGDIAYQYSTDGGGIFTPFYANSGLFGAIPSTTTTFSIPGLTSLSLLVIRSQATAHLASSTSSTETLNTTNMFAAVTKVSTLSPYGGIAGLACLIPQILQFTDTTILILGNGLPPQTVDVTLLAASVPSNVTNTFTANYPSWQASVAWNVGDQISVIIGGVTYLFTSTQGGLSGSTTPAFSATLGSTVIDNQVIWRNSGAVSTSPAPRGAAHGIVYAGSLWIANTSPQTTTDKLDGPTVIKMSDANNPQSWNPLNVAFIGRDDGTQITGLASFTIAEAGIAPTGSLCVFKEFSTFQIFGVFGANNFQIDQAQTDMGCIAARSIQFLPGFGITRMTHLGFAIFDGVRDRLISEEIRPYLFGGVVQQSDIVAVDFSFVYFSKGVQSTTPPMYFCACPLLGAGGVMTRVFCYDLVMKAWMIIDLPWPISTLTSVRVGEGKPVLLAGRSDTGVVNRLQEGDVQWDAATQAAANIKWSIQANDILIEGGSVRAFYRALTIRGQCLDPALPPTISVSITLDGKPMTPTPINYFIEPQPGSNQFQLDVDILMNAQVAHVTLAGAGRLIIDSLDWEAQPKGGRKVIG